MSIIVHLVRKDWERVRLPLFAWYALIAGKAWCVWRLMRANDVETDLEPLGSLVGLLNGIEAVAGALIVLQMAFEDKPWSGTAFASTRPIGRGQLLRGKAAGAFLFLIAVPVLLLVPVWLAAGFSASELCVAAADWALVQGLFVALGLLAGAYAREMWQVLLAVPLVGGVLLCCAVYLRREPAPPLWLSTSLALVVVGVGVLFAYRVRRRVSGLFVVVLGLAGVAGMGVPAASESFWMPVWPAVERAMRNRETRVEAAHRWGFIGYDSNGKGQCVIIAQSSRPSYPLLDTFRTPLRLAEVRLVSADERSEEQQLLPFRLGTVRAASLSVTRWELSLPEPSSGYVEERKVFMNATIRCADTKSLPNP